MLCKSTDKGIGVCHEVLLGSVGIIMSCYCWYCMVEIILFYATDAVLFCQ